MKAKKACKATKRIDLSVLDQGTIFLLSPASEAGLNWVKEHLTPQIIASSGAIVVEHRYIADIVKGAQADGLIVAEETKT